MPKSPNLQTLHGSAVVLGVNGVLVQGASGSGKSTLVHALIAEYQKRNIFARWIGDDQLQYLLRGDKLLVDAPPTIAGQAEHPLHGIVDVDYTPSARIDLLVRLQYAPTLERMPDNQIDTRFPALKLISIPERQIDVSVPLVLSQLNML